MLATEWWKLLESNIVDLRYLVTNFHPDAEFRHNDFPITAYLAKKACKGIRNEIRQESNITLADRFNMAFIDHNAEELIHLFNSAWFGMPESYESRREPGFFVLCDLCEGIEEEGE
jgi:hypothetical protein